ncbi:MAG: hypothetical protein F7C07_05555 [Desulfurococcales archaeon]|nr:hypothetical protein [Desulfurococcales archaeon]
MVLFQPLLAILVPLLFAYSAISLYRSIYPYEAVKRSMEVVAEYRRLERTAKGKRDERKLKSLRPDYIRARRTLVRSILAKFLILTIFYVIGALFTAYTVPLLLSPFHVPLITLMVEGVPVASSFMIYFMVFLFMTLVLRERLL